MCRRVYTNKRISSLTFPLRGEAAFRFYIRATLQTFSPTNYSVLHLGSIYIYSPPCNSHFFTICQQWLLGAHSRLASWPALRSSWLWPKGHPTSTCLIMARPSAKCQSTGTATIGSSDAHESVTDIVLSTASLANPFAVS